MPLDLERFDLKSLLNALFYALPVGICVFDAEENNLFVNRGLCEMLDYGCDMLMDYDSIGVFPKDVLDDFRIRFQAILHTTKQEGERMLEATTIQGRPITLRVLPGEFAIGETCCRIYSVTDVSELVQARKETEAAARLLRHDVREKAVTVMSAAALLGRMGPLNAKQTSMVEAMRTEGDTLLKLIEEFSRKTSGE